jgi:acetoin utilization protein AcuB
MKKLSELNGGSQDRFKLRDVMAAESLRRMKMAPKNSPPNSVSSSLQLPNHVDEVMTQAVSSLRLSHTFGDAVSLMASHHVRHSVVVDDQEKIKGVISDRDVLRALARTPDWKTKPVSEIMTHEPFVVHPHTSLSDALAQLLEKRINCLPVVEEDGKVCGILTSTDLLKSYHKVLQAWHFQER